MTDAPFHRKSKWMLALSLAAYALGWFAPASWISSTLFFCSGFLFAGMFVEAFRAHALALMDVVDRLEYQLHEARRHD